MTSIKVFISHSSKTPENVKIREAVCKGLQDEYTILVDDRIEPGSEWFPKLNEYMSECHAAVILLSEAAINSDWVKAEAAVLCSRKRSQADFALIWLPLDALRSEDVDQNNFYKTIRLTDFQSIRTFQNTDDLTAKLLESLPKAKPKSTPFDELADLIRDVLKQLKAEDATLELIWQSLKDEAQSAHDHADALARLLLREPELVYTRLRTLFEKLAHILSPQQAEKLIEIVKGHWVHPAAASLLSTARMNQQDFPVAVAINGVEIADFTGHCYARKAWPFPNEYTLIPAGKIYSLQGVQETLRETLGKSAVSSSRQDGRVKKYNHPLLLVFPLPDHLNQENNSSFGFPEEDFVKAIKEEYPNITIVLETGLNIPENLHYALPLEPLLLDGVESKQCDDFEDISYYVKSTISVN